MKKIKKEVYNIPYEIYHGETKGVLSFLHRSLRRFTLDRQYVVYDLLSPGLRFLDIGCGLGLIVAMAKDKFEEVYGVDIMSSNIEIAKNNVENRQDKNKIHFLECDAEEGLPFDDSFFDAVSCVAVLEHIFNPPSLLNEIRRVLKYKGQFMVQVPNFAWLPCRFQLLFGKLPATGGLDKLGIDWLHLHNFTPSTLRKFPESKRFKIIRFSSSGVFAKYRRWWLSGLSGDVIVKALKM